MQKLELFARPRRRDAVSGWMSLLLATVCISRTAGADSFPVRFDLLNPNQYGTYDWAIEQVNAAQDQEHSIVFDDSLNNRTLLLYQDSGTVITPPTYNLGTAGETTLDGSLVSAFRLRVPDEAPDDFTLLHVQTGTLTLVDVDIAGRELSETRTEADNLRVDTGATLGFDYTADFEVADDIIGDGRLVKRGEHVLTLSGANTYTGGTGVEAGELRGDATALQGDITVSEGAIVDFQIADGDTGSYDDVIDGDGLLAKSGAGTLSLLGSAAHTGGTDVRQGTLRTGASHLEGDVAVSSGATFELNQTVGETFDGDISGDGSLRKSGSESLTLTGVNTFAGGLFIESGRVIGTTASIPGDVILEDPSTSVVFNQTTDGTHWGNISGSGDVVKQGSGSLTLAGTNTHTGATNVEAGRLIGTPASLGTDINLTSGSALEFANADNQSFGGAVNGTGDVYKSAAGRLRLTSSLGFAGTLNVQAGTLQLEQGQGSNITEVNVAGGSLTTPGGSILSIGGSLNVAGTVSPSLDSPSGILTVGGTAQFQTGSRLVVTGNGADQSSSVSVTSTAQIDGSTLFVDLLPGDYSATRTYHVLTASSIGGSGFTMDTSVQYAFLEFSSPSVVAGGNGQQVRVQVDQNGATAQQYAVTPNQNATALAMDELLASGDPDVSPIQQSWVVLTVPEVPGVLDAVSGDTLSAFGNARLAGAQHFNDALSQRFTASRFEADSEGGHPDDDGSVAGVDVASYFDPMRTRFGFSAWLDPYGVFGSVDGRDGASDMKYRTYGVNAGIDYRFPARLRFKGSENIRLGMALGYTGHSVRNRGSVMTGTGHGVQVAGYGAWQSPRFHAGAALRYAYTSMESRREIVFGNVLQRPKGEFAGDEIGALIEVGGHFGDPDIVAFRPLASFQYARLEQDGFRESGAGALNLEVSDMNIDSMLTKLGARISRLISVDGEHWIEPEFRVGWTHEFGDRGRPVESRFYQTGGTPFLTKGAEPDRDSAFLGTGYVISIADVPVASLNYDVYFEKHHTRHAIWAKFFLRW